jgi:uncharacterized membrane protein YdfJ with MMPL/SSD domain
MKRKERRPKRAHQHKAAPDPVALAEVPEDLAAVPGVRAVAQVVGPAAVPADGASSSAAKRFASSALRRSTPSLIGMSVCCRDL